MVQNLDGLVVVIQGTTGVVLTVDPGGAVADKINDVVAKMGRAL